MHAMESGAVCMDSGTDEGDEVHVEADEEEEEVGCMTGRRVVNWLDGMGSKWRERLAFIIWDTPQWEVHHKGPIAHPEANRRPFRLRRWRQLQIKFKGSVILIRS